MYIAEKMNTPVTYTCDVLVVGGGIGGIAAALSAARLGKQVILTERQFMLGGLATAGLVTIYLPLCDGMGRQVSFGLAEELLKLSLLHWHNEEKGYLNWIKNPGNSNDQSTPRYEVDFNPQLFAIDAEKCLLENGVQILYGTTAVAAHKQGERVDAVILENKSGRFAIRAKGFVDASGDADLAVFTDTPTKTFGQGNVLAAWYYSNGGHEGYMRHMLGFADIPDQQKNEHNRVELLSNRRWSGLDGQEISEMMTLTHTSILNDFVKKQKTDPAFQPTTIATVPQLRMTRRVDGAYTLDDSQVFTPFEDTVGMVSDWRRRGPVYEVPFRTLYSDQTPNLFFAGRVTSVTDAMWDIMRVIPCCAVTGEAAGIAACLAGDGGRVDYRDVQDILQKRGIKLHIQDL